MDEIKCRGSTLNGLQLPELASFFNEIARMGNEERSLVIGPLESRMLYVILEKVPHAPFAFADAPGLEPQHNMIQLNNNAQPFFYALHKKFASVLVQQRKAIEAGFTSAQQMLEDGTLTDIVREISKRYANESTTPEMLPVAVVQEELEKDRDEAATTYALAITRGSGKDLQRLRVLRAQQLLREAGVPTHEVDDYLFDLGKKDRALMQSAIGFPTLPGHTL
ncbi:hypothetical protein HZB02_02215 [Candidatus Woesearchaeota archaeon]|nr:hypothetical protein [Candidatus Woesearchaeota archaeon]